MAVLSLLSAAELTSQDLPRSGRSDGVVTATVDSTVAAALERASVPGAVVVAVRDGRTVVSKGWGRASLEEDRSMRPAATVLPVGSLAKPVTAAAALELAARGALDLDADVRGTIAPLAPTLRFASPVTLRALLTHTAGFDDSDFGDAARTSEEALTLQAFLGRRMAAQAFPPGRFYRYSNHGYALVGHLVAEASGGDFATYVADSLLDALGMTDSSFDQVPSADLVERMATGHRLHGGELRSVPMDYSNVVPADGLLTTGRDVGRFLLALTDTAGAPSLAPGVRRRMLASAFRYHDSLPGVSLAFQERPVNGWPGLEHTGGRIGFTSQVVVVPEARFGLFVVLNLRDSGVRSRLTENLLDILLPRADEPVVLEGEDAPPPVTDPGQLVGSYRSIRYNRRTVEKVAVLLGMVPELTVEDRPGRTLRIGSGEFYEVEPLLFRWRGPRWYNAFRMDEAESVHLFSDHRAFEKVAWYEGRDLHRVLMGLALLVLVVILALEGLDRARPSESPESTSPGPGIRWARRLLAGTALAFASGLGLLMVVLQNLATTADYGVPLALQVSLVVILLGSLLTAPLALGTGAAWLRGWGTAGARIRLTLGTVASLLLVALLRYWNLLGLPPG